MRFSNVEDDPDHCHQDNHAEPSDTHKQNMLRRRSYLHGSSFGHGSCRSRFRSADLQLFMLHAAGSHERQSNSSDESQRLYDFPRGKTYQPIS
jgi:hypothetical protein